jgi:hypothetical protein
MASASILTHQRRRTTQRRTTTNQNDNTNPRPARESSSVANPARFKSPDQGAIFKCFGDLILGLESALVCPSIAQDRIPLRFYYGQNRLAAKRRGLCTDPTRNLDQLRTRGGSWQLGVDARCLVPPAITENRPSELRIDPPHCSRLAGVCVNVPVPGFAPPPDTAHSPSGLQWSRRGAYKTNGAIILISPCRDKQRDQAQRFTSDLIAPIDYDWMCSCRLNRARRKPLRERGLQAPITSPQIAFMCYVADGPN